MLERIFPSDVLYFISFLYRKDLFTLEDLGPIFESFFIESPALKNSRPVPKIIFPCPFHPMKTYYSKEMGEADLLDRTFHFLLMPKNRDEFVNLKIRAIEQEKFLLEKFQRIYPEKNLLGRVLNIDAGYVSLDQVILSTTKPYYHRLYLGEGVYGELELYYQNHNFQAFPWSYPDYQNENHKRVFKQMREFLKIHLNPVEIT